MRPDRLPSLLSVVCTLIRASTNQDAAQIINHLVDYCYYPPHKDTWQPFPCLCAHGTHPTPHHPTPHAVQTQPKRPTSNVLYVGTGRTYQIRSAGVLAAGQSIKTQPLAHSPSPLHTHTHTPDQMLTRKYRRTRQ
mmetsp:Transcript_19983/g.48503  ORF Transcript_19983/g.48503 Transcript_19983/m.48503 type:complete len:135 (-) Transcript_19983:609-1013(-)